MLGLVQALIYGAQPRQHPVPSQHRQMPFALYVTTTYRSLQNPATYQVCRIVQGLLFCSIAFSRIMWLSLR